MSTVTARQEDAARNAYVGGGWVWIDGPRDGDGWCTRPIGSVPAHRHCIADGCGICLVGKRWDAFYCSNACRQKAYRLRARVA